MFDDMKTKGALQKINEGGSAKLSRSQIILSLVNLNAVFKPMKQNSLKRMPQDKRDKIKAIMDWYKDIRADKFKETYDKAKLDQVSQEILSQLKELTGPTAEEIEAEVRENDEDVKAAEKIDLDNFFDSDEPEDEPEDEPGDDDSE